MNDTVAAIVGAFFIIGIAAGIIAVVAMSVLRAERRGHRGDYADPVDDDTTSDGRSRWPGESDTDFRGR